MLPPLPALPIPPVPVEDCACGIVVTERLMTEAQAHALTAHIHHTQAGKWQVRAWRRHQALPGTRYELTVAQVEHDVVIRTVTTTGADHWEWMVRALTGRFQYP